LKRENGVTLLVLLITIIVILIIAGTAAIGITTTVKKAQEMDLKAETRNIEEIVLREKALILAGKDNPRGVKIVSDMTVTDALTGDTVNIVGADNNFYYFESKTFENEFDVKISEGKTNRYYLVSFTEKPYVIPILDPIVTP
jgi:type II secretory pathway pseudopilin PulG